MKGVKKMMMIIFVLLIVLILYKTGDLERFGTRYSNHKEEHDPKQVLDLRLAKGEITVDEYMKLKSVL